MREIMKQSQYFRKLRAGFKVEIMDENIVTNPCECGKERAAFHVLCEECIECSEDSAREHGLEYTPPEMSSTFDVSNYVFIC